MVLNDGGQERIVSFSAGATIASSSLYNLVLTCPFSGSEKLDALLIDLKQAKEVVARTQAAM
jgi:hypothetical protein